MYTIEFRPKIQIAQQFNFPVAPSIDPLYDPNAPSSNHAEQYHMAFFGIAVNSCLWNTYQDLILHSDLQCVSTLS